MVGAKESTEGVRTSDDGLSRLGVGGDSDGVSTRGFLSSFNSSCFCTKSPGTSDGETSSELTSAEARSDDVSASIVAVSGDGDGDRKGGDVDVDLIAVSVGGEVELIPTRCLPLRM